MILLPIVGRELRVAARRRETYWTRLSLPIVAIAIGTLIFVFTVGLPANLTGRYIFQSLAGLQFLYCLAYGRRATADSISYEKREGTLGLLFLTDLKGHDIVFGKLVATSTRGFYGLMAVFPVLAIPLLLGGITNGEFWRMVLVLVNTFLFSLAVGIFGSSLSRDFRRAMAGNLALLLGLVGMLPAVGLLLSYFTGKPLIPALFLSCPAYSFFICSDTKYAVQAENFWWSLGATHFITWLLIILASWVVPRAWHDQPNRARKSLLPRLWRQWNYGSQSKQIAHRRELLNSNAFLWLASRVTRKTWHVWTFLILMVAWWLLGWAMSGSVWFDSSVAALTFLMLNGTLKTWLTIEAGQQLAEDKRTGAFELLLTVPLKVEEILSGQVLALRRQFAWPFLAVISVELLLIGAVLVHPNESSVAIWLAGMVMLATDMITLTWVAMATALTTKSHNQATFLSLTKVLGLPWALLGLITGVCYLYSAVALGREWSPSTDFLVSLWFGLGLAVDAILGVTAWRFLTRNFHQIALQTRHTASSTSSHEVVDDHSLPRTNKPLSLGDESNAQKLKSKSSKLSVRRITKPAWALVIAFIVLAIGFAVFKPRDNLPPATVVPVMSPARNALKVSPTYGSAIFVLPDGSLWRWGQGGATFPQSLVPVQIGTNRDWVTASACGNHFLGLRNDGTIWEWGWINNQLIMDPELADPGTNWISVAASAVHSVALKRDGTLWTWGRYFISQAFIGSALYTTNHLQVGTNDHWAAIASHPNGNYALAKDGSLWTWGAIPMISSQNAPKILTLPIPTQISSETNWAGFASGFTPLFQDRSGNIWLPFHSSPNGHASVAACCSLIASNAMSKGLAAAVTDVPSLFQLHADGTLWERPYPNAGQTTGEIQQWKQVGKRNDWVSLWSASGTAFGLTSDNTIWTWGYDPTRSPKHSFSSWFKTMQSTVRSKLSKMPVMIPRPPRAFQKQPRPLIRIFSTNEAAANPLTRIEDR
jgi:hypothetical protein